MKTHFRLIFKQPQFITRYQTGQWVPWQGYTAGPRNQYGPQGYKAAAFSDPLLSVLLLPNLSASSCSTGAWVLSF